MNTLLYLIRHNHFHDHLSESRLKRVRARGRSLRPHRGSRRGAGRHGPLPQSLQPAPLPLRRCAWQVREGVAFGEVKQSAQAARLFPSLRVKHGRDRLGSQPPVLRQFFAARLQAEVPRDRLPFAKQRQAEVRGRRRSPQAVAARKPRG